MHVVYTYTRTHAAARNFGFLSLSLYLSLHISPFDERNETKWIFSYTSACMYAYKYGDKSRGGGLFLSLQTSPIRSVAKNTLLYDYNNRENVIIARRFDDIDCKIHVPQHTLLLLLLLFLNKFMIKVLAFSISCCVYDITGIVLCKMRNPNISAGICKKRTKSADALMHTLKHIRVRFNDIRSCVRVSSLRRPSFKLTRLYFPSRIFIYDRIFMNKVIIVIINN